MAVKTLYPHPPCPGCGQDENKAVRTFYAPNGKIVRYRKCKLCGKNFYSLQSCEEVIDPAEHKVVLGNWRTNGSQIKIVKVGTNQLVDL